MKKIILITTCVFGLNFSTNASIELIRYNNMRNNSNSDLFTQLCNKQEDNNYHRCNAQNLQQIYNLNIENMLIQRSNIINQQVNNNICINSNNNNGKESVIETFIKGCFEKCKNFFMKKNLFKNCMGN